MIYMYMYVIVLITLTINCSLVFSKCCEAIEVSVFGNSFLISVFKGSLPSFSLQRSAYMYRLLA